MKKPLLITLIIISLIIIILIMKKLLTLSTATSLAITSVVPNSAQAQATDNTQESQPIKHELARMPEQASWTVERWNINDVDFELKEISKETRNQPAQFEVKVNMPSQGKKSADKLNPVASFLEAKKNYIIKVNKNKFLYRSYLDFLNELNSYTNPEYWNIHDYQLKKVPNQQQVKVIKKLEFFYRNYAESDFPKLQWLVNKEYFVGEVKIEGIEHLIYTSQFLSKYRDSLIKHTEHVFNVARADDGNGNIDREKLSTLPTLEELFEDKFSFIAIIDKQTRLPLYYSDCISVRKYNLDEEHEQIEVPQVIQDNITWYVEHLLPTLK